MNEKKFIKLKLKFVPNLLVKMKKALDKPSHTTLQEVKTLKKITTPTHNINYVTGIILHTVSPSVT